MIKRSTVLFLMLSVLAMGIAGSADAQFLKKLFGKKNKKNKYSQTVNKKEGKKADKRSRDDEEEKPEKKLSKKEKRKKQKEDKKRRKEDRKSRELLKKKKQEPVKKGRPPKLLGSIRPKAEPQFPTTRLKDRYRIEVLSPIYLDDLVKGESVTFKDKVPERSAEGLAFYQGVMIAADSLKRAGFELDIYMHDVGSFSESSEMLVTFHKLDSADLILGAVQSRDIAVIAGHARRKRINFVSTLSPADGSVKDNQFFTLLQPSLKSHCEFIAADVAKKFPGQRITLLYRNSVQADDNAYRYMTGENSTQITFEKLLCNTVPSKAELLTVFDTTRPNVVVVPIVDQVFADSLLRKLSRSFPNTHFEVYGMPPWNGIANLKKANAYPNLMVKVTFPFNFEAGENDTKSYINRVFRRDYGGKPGELVYRGYETMFWYANLLKKYGTIFNTKYSDISDAPFTKFEVAPQYDKAGGLLYNENHKLFLSTYEGGVYKTE